jgi:hypothetical protein
MDAMQRLWWQSAQAVGLLLTVALLAGLWMVPEPTLRVLWYAVIPLLPAVFLLQPALWRNVCPLATLNTLPGARTRGLKLDARVARWTVGIGILLLVVLVPARRFLFNTDGRALALVIVAVAVLALVAGFVFDRKAGFCNALCPVLPVERLYGQRPLLPIATAHCVTCSLCTARGCLDISAEKSVPHVLGPARDSSRWLATPYGAFAAAFPGFVVAYYLVPDGPLADAALVYLAIAAGIAISYAVVAALVLLLRVSAAVALPALGITALALYYWYGAPGIASAWQLDTGTVHGIRGAAAILLGVWVRARVRPVPAASGRRVTEVR